MADIQDAVADRGMRPVFLVAELDLEAADDLELVTRLEQSQRQMDVR